MDTDKLIEFREKLDRAKAFLQEVIDGKRGSKKAGLKFRKVLTEIKNEATEIKRETLKDREDG
jgi:hypothetical protein